MPQVEIVTKKKIDIDLDTLALVFTHMSDDEQCRFFVKVGELCKEFGERGISQWYFVGCHLRNCKCSTDEARAIIDEIHHAMHNGKHGADGL